MASEKGKTFEGFETFFNGLIMTLKMFKVVLLSTVILYLIAVVAASIYSIGGYSSTVLYKFYLAKCLYFFNQITGHPSSITWPNPDGTAVTTTAAAIVTNLSINNYIAFLQTKLTTVFKYTLFSIFFFPAAIVYFKIKAKKQSSKKYVRGARFMTVKAYNALRKIKKDLPVGSLKMPVEAETKHTVMIGKAGAGKTVAFSQILNRVIERIPENRDKGLIYDVKGDYLQKFFNPERDILFNPLDRRSIKWNIFSEIETKMDITAIASSLIPKEKSSNSAYWNDAARDVFAGILQYCISNDLKTNKDLWRMVSAPAPKISSALARTTGAEKGARHVEDPESKQALSVLSVMMQYTSCFEYMQGQEGKFQTNEWLKKGSGFIFLTNYRDISDTLKPILSLFIDQVTRKLLSMPDSRDRSVFLFLDEFGSLQKLSSILEFVTQGRSKGGRCFIGIQDYGQIEKLYGRNHKQSILNSCSNKVLFGLSDENAAEEASKSISEIEYREMDKSVSMGVNAMKDGVSFSEKTKRERLILPAEFINMKELKAVTKFANFDPIKNEFKWVGYPEKNESFVMIDGVSIKSQEMYQSA